MVLLEELLLEELLLEELLPAQRRPRRLMAPKSRRLHRPIVKLWAMASPRTRLRARRRLHHTRRHLLMNLATTMMRVPVLEPQRRRA